MKKNKALKYLKLSAWFIPVVIFFALLPLIGKEFTLAEGTDFGFTFSAPYAEELNLDWQPVYTDMLEKMQVKKLRLSAYWNRVEPRPDQYTWEELDWQVEQAGVYNAEVVLAIGRRLPRWPECHDPVWLHGLSDQELEIAQLEYVEATVERYKGYDHITAWQVENEPFLSVFGECPPLNVALLEKEIALVKELDPARPVMVTESGELSTWIQGAKRADIIGTSMYRVTWNNFWGYFYYPIPPAYYYYKAKYITDKYPAQSVIVSELQVEPWTTKPILFETLADQFESMDFDQVQENIEYAKTTGFEEVYLWGVEWWWWLKYVKNIPEFWDYGEQLFAEQL